MLHSHMGPILKFGNWRRMGATWAINGYVIWGPYMTHVFIPLGKLLQSHMGPILKFGKWHRMGATWAIDGVVIWGPYMTHVLPVYFPKINYILILYSNIKCYTSINDFELLIE